MSKFEDLVYGMRAMQKHYFKMRDPLSLAAAKSYEKKVDAHLASIGKNPDLTGENKQEQQPRLF